MVVSISTIAGQQVLPHRLLAQVEAFRQEANGKLDSQRKVSLGQFFTPIPVAQQLAELFVAHDEEVRLLDAGAGVGVLLAAFIAKLCQCEKRPRSVHIVAYEIDPLLVVYLRQTFTLCEEICASYGIALVCEIRQADFIQSTLDRLHGSLFTSSAVTTFSHIIMNPPYRKIHARSEHRRLLQRLGIEASNLYSGFVATAIQLLEPQGELVAITPRSFCNGPYFKQFRRFFLGQMALDRLHLYESRQAAFRDDAVLQENIVFHAVKTAQKFATVVVTASAGIDVQPGSRRLVPYRQIVQPDDPELFIRIAPDESSARIAERIYQLPSRLEDIGLGVSTGRVVDFRVRDFLRAVPENGAVPLIYPVHCVAGAVSWPKHDSRKPNALVMNPSTAALLVPNEHYVLVRRLSAKEEKHRVVAVVYDAAQIDATHVGFENHLNYFHQQGRGMDLSLARGLAAYLNSALVDTHFRQFNGHTQVNATDLRSIRYPTRDQLFMLGATVSGYSAAPDECDGFVERELL